MQDLELTTSDFERFVLLKQTVHNGILTCIVVGHALREIKERQLYIVDGFKTFEEFCDKEWGWTKRYCNQLILDAKAINSLPIEQRKLITSGSAARELAKVPEVLRPVVIAKATKNGTAAATGSAIREATPTTPTTEKLAAELPARPKGASTRPPKRPGPKPAAISDRLGYEVPAESLELWNRRMEAEELITYAGAVVTRLKKIQQEGHPLYVEVDLSDAISCFTKGIQEIERARPYAICPECSGKMPKKECECKGRGFVSQFYWNTFVPEELRKMRTAK